MQGQQLELELFFPLTEQIPLDLDYTPCNLFKVGNFTYNSNSASLLVYNGPTTTSSTISANFEIKPSSTTAGYYKFGGSTFHIYLEKKPSALTRWAMAKVFNFYWNDK
jgi:hypothetical protein